MTFPTSPDIEFTLQSLELISSPNINEFQEIHDLALLNTWVDRTSQYKSPALYLAVSNKKMQFKSLCALTQKYLRSLGIICDLESQKIILAMFTQMAERNKTARGATSFFSRWLDAEATSTLCFRLFGDTIKPFQPISVGEFTISKVDPKKIRARAERAECDFFQLYPDEFQNTIGIERIGKPVRILDAISFLQSCHYSPTARFLIELYFGSVGLSVGNEHVSDFMMKYCMYALHTQNLFNLYNERVVESGTFAIAFQWQMEGRHKGYFMVHRTGKGVSVSVPKMITELQETIAKKPYLATATNIPMPEDIWMAARFATTASAECAGGNPSYALLNFIIALEILFGDRAKLTQTICARAAVIVSLRYGDKFEKVKSVFQRLYDARSSFVHSGEHLIPIDLEDVHVLIQKILDATVESFVNRGGSMHMDEFRKLLDICVNYADLEERPTNDVISRLGMT